MEQLLKEAHGFGGCGTYVLRVVLTEYIFVHLIYFLLAGDLFFFSESIHLQHGRC